MAPSRSGLLQLAEQEVRRVRQVRVDLRDHRHVGMAHQDRHREGVHARVEQPVAVRVPELHEAVLGSPLGRLDLPQLPPRLLPEYLRRLADGPLADHTMQARISWYSSGVMTVWREPAFGFLKWARGVRSMIPCSSAQFMQRTTVRARFRFVPDSTA